MSIAAAAELVAPQPGGSIRVMVVDDAVVVRGLLSRWVDAEPDMKITGAMRTGREAIDQFERSDPDVVVLDVDMPELDGISALPLLLAKKRDLVIIMASTLTRRNAEVSLRALALGAADYIPKPLTTREVTASPAFRRELIEKIRQLGRRHRLPAARERDPAPAPERLRGPSIVPAGRIAPAVEGGGATGPQLRPFGRTPPRALVIGTSTGGPQALIRLLGALGPVIDSAPVLITQHMPPTFTTVLAEHLTQASHRPAREGTDGEPVVAGTVYVAPGGRHMRVARRNGQPTIALDDGELVNFCKPAVDPLFASAAEVWGGGTLALVLTGMGVDGTRGAADIVAAGGSVIAQDEATSVVWGMPGSVARAGLCAAVLPLDGIAAKIVRVFSGDRS
jgi:two-component system chemotaxis response regulator CheB